MVILLVLWFFDASLVLSCLSCVSFCSISIGFLEEVVVLSWKNCCPTDGTACGGASVCVGRVGVV